MRKLPALRRNQKVNLAIILIYSQGLASSSTKKQPLFSTDVSLQALSTLERVY